MKATQKAHQANAAQRSATRAARVASEPQPAEARTRPRGGARPGAGRPRRTTEEIRKARYLHDLMVLFLSARVEKNQNWPALSDDEQAALKERGPRVVAGWLVSRVMFKRDDWFIRHVGPAGKPLQPVRLKQALLPPTNELDPMGWFRQWLLPRVTTENRDAGTRSFVRQWNRLVGRPDVVHIRYCEACFRVLAAPQARACSPACMKLVRRHDHGR